MSGKVDLKVVLLGNSLSGKTCLMNRYLYGKFLSSTQATVGAAFGAKTLQIDKRNITLGIWDTAGSERYESMSKFYYREARAAIICFDLTDRKSFEKVKFWVNELKEHEPECVIYLCGNKEDLISEGLSARATDQHIISKYCTEINAQYVETSSKTGHNIETLFKTIAENFAKENPQSDPSPQKFELETAQPAASTCC